MLYRLPRGIAHREFARAGLKRAFEHCPAFEQYWHEAICLILCSDTEKRVLVDGFDPPRYVLSFLPWKAGHIPGFRVVYRCPANSADSIIVEAVVIIEKEAPK
jgi:hypothetical protein